MEDSMFDHEEMAKTVTEFHLEIGSVPVSATGVKPTPESWSLKEIVGHLVDSAANNHQRFVRLQQGDLEGFPGYDNETWIAVQRYNDYGWEPLVALWHLYNQLLLHVIRNIDQRRLENRWTVDGSTATLGFLVEDYYRHMRDHLAQFRQRLAEVSG
jgi:hypothetical protein